VDVAPGGAEESCRGPYVSDSGCAEGRLKSSVSLSVRRSSETKGGPSSVCLFLRFAPSRLPLRPVNPRPRPMAADWTRFRRSASEVSVPATWTSSSGGCPADEVSSRPARTSVVDAPFCRPSGQRCPPRRHAKLGVPALAPAHNERRKGTQVREAGAERPIRVKTVIDTFGVQADALVCIDSRCSRMAAQVRAGSFVQPGDAVPGDPSTVGPADRNAARHAIFRAVAVGGGGRRSRHRVQGEETADAGYSPGPTSTSRAGWPFAPGARSGPNRQRPPDSPR